MRKFLTLLVMVVFTTLAMAQNKTVTGKVTDEKGAPVANASVLVKGTTKGVTTGNDGSFSILVSSTAKSLVVSSVSFTSQEVGISGKNTVSVKLASAANDLSEVVVVGYSTSTKQAFTGSAKTVSSEQITNKAVSNVSQALAGEVAGVRVINPSGQPGATATVRIISQVLLQLFVLEVLVL